MHRALFSGGGEGTLLPLLSNGADYMLTIILQLGSWRIIEVYYSFEPSILVPHILLL